MKKWSNGRDHSIILPFLLICVHFLNLTSAFDCRVFIFHPSCRGSFGKRSVIPALTTNSNSKNEIQPEHHDEAIKRALSRAEFYQSRGKRSKRDLGVDLGTFTGFLKRNHLLGYDSFTGETEGKGANRFKRHAAATASEIDDLNGFTNFMKKNSDLGGFSNFVKKDLDGFASFMKKNADLGGFANFMKKDASDLDGFASFMKKNADLGGFANFMKRNADDLGGFSSFVKRDPELGGFANFVKKRSPQDLGGFSNFLKRNPQELGGFSNFLKRNPDLGGGFSNFLKRDLGGFSNFVKRGAASGYQDLGGFSNFLKRRTMRSPYYEELGRFSNFYKKRNSDNLGSFSTFNKRSAPNYDDLSGFSDFVTKK